MTNQAHAVLNGSRRALAQLLTAVENENPAAEPTLDALYPHTGRAHIIGVTGAPGTGKSTLVTRIVQAYREQDRRVAVLAIDPTSPYTGGAILGDRVRMQPSLTGDHGVFIRSMATRGSSGGIAQTAPEAVRVLDAAGFDKVIVETVGAGQSEVAVAQMAHTTLVVEAPGLGDGVQAIKAGILEIADILVVNKADHPATINTVRGLRLMLELGHPTKPDPALWMPPIIETIATDGHGIHELITQIETHFHRIIEYNKKVQRERAALEAEFTNRLAHALLAQWHSQVSSITLTRLLDQVQARDITIREAVTQALSAQQPDPTSSQRGEGSNRP